MIRSAASSLLALTLFCGIAVAGSERKLQHVVVTYYWLIDEGDLRYRGPRSVELRDVHGNVIATTSRWFRRDLRMEGSGRLRDGRVVTYMRDVAGEPRYRVTHNAYGNGIGECPLLPYRTVAADPHVIPPGSTIRIPALEGARLPDGTTHDGIFKVNDRAPFHGLHVDVFTGVGPRATRPFVRHGCRSRSRVTVYVVAEPDGRGCHSR